jgi:thiol-disulfide isomerase/thioredoxin
MAEECCVPGGKVRRMRIRHRTFICGAVLLAAFWLLGTFPATHASQGLTIEDAYPGLASGILKTARLDELDKGVILKTNDFQIDESFLDELLKDLDPDLRQEYEKHLIYFVEEEAIEKVLLHEARKSSSKKGGPEKDIIASFVKEKIPPVTVSDEEVSSFYEENKESLGDAPVEQAKVWIGEYLVERKKQAAVLSYVGTLVGPLNVRLDADWVEKQSKLAGDNPVDKARFSGKPTLVEFGAAGCVPCDMMQPILDDLKEKFRDRLNIVFVHVGEEQILSARYGINLIPVQVFFDKDGGEFFRHVGFFPQAEIEKKLAAMGVL